MLKNPTIRAVLSVLTATLVTLPSLQADVRVLNPTSDSHIRASQSNQGSSTLAIVGDTATADDFLRAVFAFDLSDPALTGATINSVTLALTINSRDTASGGSGNELSTINLHKLDTSFTNSGVTWTSRDGTNNWSQAGADFGATIASNTANAGTINTGDTVTFSSPTLVTSITDALGSSLPLLVKLATEDGNRSVFRFASLNNSVSTRRPTLTIDYSPPVTDPDLNLDPSNGDPDLNFGSSTGDLPFDATRTIRFNNDGTTQDLEITSATLDISNIFSLTSIAVNGVSGQTLPVTLTPNDFIEFTITANSTEYFTLASATLAIVTNIPAQNQSVIATASYNEPGIAVLHPAIPGTPVSTSYQVRIDGVPVPVNDENYFDFHTAFFSMDEPVMVEIEFLSGVSYTSIHPLRHGFQPQVDGNTISFPLLKPLKLVIKASGALPLVLCATPNEVNVPASGDPDVIYFGPGVHEPGLIEPVSGQTVYLASGALVKGRIEVRDATGVTVRGRGTLDSRGYSVRANKTNAILFERCSDVHIEGIGIRGGSWWQTLFLVTSDASAIHLSLLGKTVNTDGIDIDGVQRFVARDCFIRCEDDGFGWHAVDGEANGQLPTEDCLAEDCVIWNTSKGNGLRVGASMETELFQNITFRNIDVLEHAGAAIYADHSDWATNRNIRFENFTDETTKQTVDIYIDKTRYSNSTGFRDERGHYDGLYFINLNSPGGDIRLRGYDAGHLIENVFFQNSFLGGLPIDGPEDIVTNEFVTGVTFELGAELPIQNRTFNLIDNLPGWVELSFTSSYGSAYSIQASSDLGITDPYTELLQATGAGPFTKVRFFDPALLTEPRRFYVVDGDIVYGNTTPTVRILCLGDSITEGNTDMVVYKGPLFDKLSAAEYRFEYVGSKTSSYTSPTSGVVSLKHEGYSGQNCTQIAASFSTNSPLYPADIVIIHAAHNLNLAQEVLDPAGEAAIVTTVENATRSMIQTARTTNPSVKILLAQAITSGKLPKYSYIPAVNTRLGEIAVELHTASQPVIIVDQATGFDWTTDTTVDKVHPNASGGEKMAQKFFDALVPLLE